MKRIRLNLSHWLILACLAALAGCDQSPTGRRQLALVPDSAMADLGEQSFAQMKEQNPIFRGPNVNQLVSCVSRSLVDAASRLYPSTPQPQSWEVVVFEDPAANAFALPGGKIGVHSGLLDVAANPHQLATVIGHEIAHVLADHGNERLTQQLGIKAGLLLVGLFTEGAIAEDQLQQALGIGVQLGITLPFSRAHEEEADLMGLYIMARAGFLPGESLRLWQNMAEASGQQPLEFLSTHPNHDTRIELLRSHLDQAKKLSGQASTPNCG